MASIEPTTEQISQFLAKMPEEVPIVMINLLKYREQAQYPEGFDAEPCSGREAYARYSFHALQHVASVGGRPIWLGGVHTCLIAPAGEDWDDAVLVEYPSRQAFLTMLQNPEYLKIAAHRTAALADSRLICTTTLLTEPAILPDSR